MGVALEALTGDSQVSRALRAEALGTIGEGGEAEGRRQSALHSSPPC